MANKVEATDVRSPCRETAANLLADVGPLTGKGLMLSRIHQDFIDP